MKRKWLVITLLGALISATPHLASAKPKGLGGGQCGCVCLASDGMGGTLQRVVTYDSQGFSCTAFEDLACNVDNPNTGGVATGQLYGCSPTGSSGSATVGVNPFGGVRVIWRRTTRIPTPPIRQFR
jgi:hypothetical protein